MQQFYSSYDHWRIFCCYCFKMLYFLEQQHVEEGTELLENPLSFLGLACSTLHPPSFEFFPSSWTPAVWPWASCSTSLILHHYIERHSTDLEGLLWASQALGERVHDKVNICGTPFLTLCQTHGRYRVIFCTKQCRG